MEEWDQDDAQKSSRLESTQQCVANYKLARELGHSPELCHTLFQLTEKIARMEWGPETKVDDFSEPGFIVVTNGAKTKKI